MTEDAPNIHTDQEEPMADIYQLHGPPPPTDRENAKFLTHEQVAYEIWLRRHANRSLIETTDKLEQLKFDGPTGLLNRGPGEEQAKGLIQEVISRQADAPTAVALLMVDVKGLHDINSNHGHQVGDGVIKKTADQMRIIANLLSLFLRTYDRRHTSAETSSEEHRHGDRRHDQGKDIIWRRGGDEFVAVLPVSVSKELVTQILSERLDHPERYVAEETPEIRWGLAYFDPNDQPDMTPQQVIEYLEKNADPKGDGQSSRGTAAA